MFYLFIFGFALFIDGISKANRLTIKSSNPELERKIKMIIGVTLVLVSIGFY